MENYSKIGTATGGTFFYSEDGTNVQSMANTDANKRTIFDLLAKYTLQADHNNEYKGTFEAYVRPAETFVTGTTEKKSLATLKGGTLGTDYYDVTQVLYKSPKATGNVDLSGNVLTYVRENVITTIGITGEGNAADALEKITCSNSGELEIGDLLILKPDEALAEPITVYDRQDPNIPGVAASPNIDLIDNRYYVMDDKAYGLILVWEGSRYEEVVRNNYNTGRIYSDAAIQSTTGTIEETISSYTLPADFVRKDGEGIFIRAWGKTAFNSHTKTIKLTVGATTVLQNTGVSSTKPNGADWYAEAFVTRRDATKALYGGKLFFDGGAGDVEVGQIDPLNWANTIVLAIKATTPDNTGDISVYGFNVQIVR